VDLLNCLGLVFLIVKRGHSELCMQEALYNLFHWLIGTAKNKALEPNRLFRSRRPVSRGDRRRVEIGQRHCDIRRFWSPNRWNLTWFCHAFATCRTKVSVSSHYSRLRLSAHKARCRLHY